MKLCYIANANSIHTWRWIEPFIRRGDQVYLVSYAPVHRLWEGLSDLVDLTVRSNTPKMRFLQWGWWLRRYVRRIQPDILHAHQLVAAGWLGVMAGYRPFVVSSWGSDLLIEPQRSVWRRLLVAAVLKRCDYLTVPTQHVGGAARALGFPDSRMLHIPWGVETEVFSPQPDDRVALRTRYGFGQEDRIVLCPRKIAPLYNHDVVLEAARAAAQEVAKLRLVFLRFGEDPKTFAQLDRLISSQGMGDLVSWLPAQGSAEEMAGLYRMADVVISIPSSEGYGFSVYEAMACGCPTLISDLPVFEDELSTGVHTVKAPVRDVPETSQALLRLLSDQTLRQRLRENGFAVMRGKSVEERVQQTLDLYRRLAPGSDRGLAVGGRAGARREHVA